MLPINVGDIPVRHSPNLTSYNWACRVRKDQDSGLGDCRLILTLWKDSEKKKKKKKRMIESFRIPEIQGDFLNIIKTVSTGPA